MAITLSNYKYKFFDGYTWSSYAGLDGEWRYCGKEHGVVFSFNISGLSGSVLKSLTFKATTLEKSALIVNVRTSDTTSNAAQSSVSGAVIGVGKGTLDSGITASGLNITSDGTYYVLVTGQDYVLDALIPNSLSVTFTSESAGGSIRVLTSTNTVAKGTVYVFTTTNTPVKGTLYYCSTDGGKFTISK